MEDAHREELQRLQARLTELQAEVEELDKALGGPPYPTAEEGEEILLALDRKDLARADIEDRIAQIRRLYEGV